MAANKKKAQALRAAADKKSRKVLARQSFWKGVAEGFGGPAMMGLDVVVRDLRASFAGTVEAAPERRNEYARALVRATSDYVEKKALQSFVVKQKRLDRSGKKYDVDVVVVKPRQIHGEPQE